MIAYCVFERECVCMATVTTRILSHVPLKDSQAYPVRELSCVLNHPAPCHSRIVPSRQDPTRGMLAGVRITILDGRQILGRYASADPLALAARATQMAQAVCQLAFGGCFTATQSKTLSIAFRFMAFDKHLNMVLGDSEELRKLPPKKNQEEVWTRLRTACRMLKTFPHSM